MLRKLKNAVLMMSVLLLCVLNAGAAIQVTPEADRIFINGRIYTSDHDQKWVQAVAIKDGRFVYVGDNEGVNYWRGDDTQIEDLDGQLVLPGLIDGHAHPGLLASFAQADPMPFSVLGPVPYASKQDTLAWLKEYAEENPELEVIISAAWGMEEFGAQGPHKSDLDAVVSDRPVMLFSNYGHSVWLNSKALDMLGVTKDTEPAAGPSYFYRDKNGEPTGYVKEFAATSLVDLMPKPTLEEFDSVMQFILNAMAGRGVTTLYDAGNAGQEDFVYSSMARLDKSVGLPLRVEGSYHIILPQQLDIAVAELKRLKENYSTKNLTFNSVKIHFDGVHWNINTAAMLEPYNNTNNEMGRIIVTEERLKDFILELHHEKIDLHMHTWGDRATRIALNAYEKAEQQLGRKLATRMTLTHLIWVDEADKKRFKQLDVIANYTMHWFGIGEMHQDHHHMGHRADHMMPAKSLTDHGAIVSYGNDELSILGLKNFSPFSNMQAGITRQGLEGGADALFFQPQHEKLNIDEVLRGYTQAGAYQLRRDHQLGSITVGKDADLVVMADDIFVMDPYDLHKARVNKTIMAGKDVYERTLWQSIKSTLIDWGLDYIVWANTK